jgi:DNA-binding NarL/FixJ family response regulator
MRESHRTNSETTYQHFLLLDDHEIVRFGVKQMIRQEWPASKIYEAESFMDAERLIRNHRIQLMITDIKIPGLGPGDSVTEIQRFAKRLPVVVFSMYPRDLMEKQLDDAQIVAYMCKNEGLDNLRDALKHVMGKLPGWTPPQEETQENPFAQLSSQELNIAVALVHGKSNSEICRQFDLKPSTVSTYKSRIYEKLGVQSYSEILKLAYTYGIDFDESGGVEA